MPLLDHFRPPLSLRRHWHSFHNAWVTYIASDLNTRLPEGYFAEPNVQFGIEIDVAAFEELGPPGVSRLGGWSPPEPTLTVPLMIVTDSVQVAVFDATAGPVLAGAIELVSPANKDRPAHRGAFVSKYETYLRSGLGLVVVDVVTDRGGDLHGELMARLLEAGAFAEDEGLSATAYHPVDREGRGSLDVWREELDLGRVLPVLPLWLKGGPCLPLDLEAAYERARRELRIGDRA